MKKFLIALSFAIAMTSVCVPASACSCGRIINGRITAVSSDTVEVTTRDGNVWMFYGDNYEVGDRVIAGFDTKGTINRTDDELILCSIVG